MSVLRLRPTRLSQPIGPVEIDWENPDTRGLRLAQGDHVDLVSRRASTAVGTRLSPTLKGMARGFGATNGVGSTDSLTTNLTAHAAQRTYWARVMVTGANNSGSLGRIFDKRTVAVSTSTEFWYADQTSGVNGFTFQRVHSTTEGQWRTPVGSIAPNTWQDVCAVYDSSSTANIPALYTNGQLQTLTTVTSPSGTLETNAAEYIVGNRITDNARVFPGFIQLVLIWDRLLTAAEVARVSANPNALFRTSRSLYFGLDTAPPSGFKPHFARGSNQIIRMFQ